MADAPTDASTLVTPPLRPVAAPVSAGAPAMALRSQDPNASAKHSVVEQQHHGAPDGVVQVDDDVPPTASYRGAGSQPAFMQPVAARRNSFRVSSGVPAAHAGAADEAESAVGFVPGVTPTRALEGGAIPSETVTPERPGGAASFHNGGFGRPNASIGRTRPAEDARRRMTASAEFKVVLVGSSNAGKTCLAHRYVRKWYSEVGIPTVGAAYNSVYETITTAVDLDDVSGPRGAPSAGAAQSRPPQRITVKIGLWDTAGQEQFAELVPLYFRDARAVVLVADCTRRDALPDLKRWLLKVAQSAPPDVQRYLVLSKTDLTLDRYVTLEEATAFAAAMDAFETSGFAAAAMGRVGTTVSSRHSAAGTITPDRRTNASMSTIAPDRRTHAPGIQVFEVSSKTGEGVQPLFDCVASDCWSSFVDKAIAERQSAAAGAVGKKGGAAAVLRPGGGKLKKKGCC